MNRLGDDDAPIAEINVTPFVDVLLILLVVFMLTANFILSEGLKIQLPTASSTEKIQGHQTFRIAIDRKNNLYLNDKLTTLPEVQRAAETLLHQGGQISVVLSVDKDVVYSAVVKIMDKLRSVGVVDFAFHLDPSRVQ